MGYMAPEIIENTAEKRRVYDFKCDIFSFGIISHMLLMGSNPLKGKNYDETYIKNKACNIQLDHQAVKDKLGSSGVKFFTDMFEKNPKKRPSAAELLEYNVFKLKQFSESTNCKTNKQQDPASYKKMQEEIEEMKKEEVAIKVKEKVPNMIKSLNSSNF